MLLRQHCRSNLVLLLKAVFVKGAKTTKCGWQKTEGHRRGHFRCWISPPPTFSHCLGIRCQQREGHCIFPSQVDCSLSQVFTELKTGSDLPESGLGCCRLGSVWGQFGIGWGKPCLSTFCLLVVLTQIPPPQKKKKKPWHQQSPFPLREPQTALDCFSPRGAS